MPIADKTRIYDGFVSLEGGVDAGRAANVIDPNQCVSSENMTYRGGKPAVRPAWRKLRIQHNLAQPTTSDFTNPNHSYNANGTDAGKNPDGTDKQVPGQQAYLQFFSGTMQCAHVYNPHHGPDCLMVLIGGRLFKVVPYVNKALVTELVLPQRNRSNITLAYMVQADKWFIAQDGESAAILYDGQTVRRSIGDATTRDKTEIPVGTMMAYGMGRVVLIVNDRDIAFGDLFGSSPTATDPADSLIMFTERNFLTEGFDAAIPFEQGVATGLAFFPQLDTSTGNGQLLVFSERGAQAFFLS